MMSYRKCFALAACFLLFTSAEAASRKSTVIRVPVAQPQSTRDSGSDQVESTQASPLLGVDSLSEGSEHTEASVNDTGQIEFAVSDWNARQLTRDSRLQGTSSYTRARMPALWLGWISAPWVQKRTFTLSGRAGLGLAILERGADAQLASSFSGNQTQSLYAIPVKLGVEARSPVANWQGIGPFVQASLVPTLAITTNSALSSGETLLGLPWELSVGVSAELFDVAALSLAWIQSFGTLGGSSFSGGGIQAGVRVGI